ncbi:MAG: undecaprenyl/decaprenyl-phosphate alpha-N-acetylglucosaminyl 1-phosphate transferase [Nitrospirae bacterium]|nr:undecaprenyl/decaprenyl-phosphate alpha-N-acetylglucosaminyl 1-phosphate transferase [Nitrospirota bacterium]MBI5694958.1 undecaprenyl/decaprenyl-phosphate alpha-N-acetylglucosaminyl 1-phosphate transferase [Nitrospirota bacterium]
MADIGIRNVLWTAALIAALALLVEPARGILFRGGPDWVYALAISFSITFLATPAAMRLAVKVGAVDLPDARKVHDTPTPRLGGLAVFAGVSAAVLTNSGLGYGMVAALVGGAMMVALGYFDDVRGLSSTFRLFVQLLAAGLVIASGKLLTLFPPSMPGLIANVLVTLLWIIGITNAMNLFDGMDGLAAGLSCIVAFFMGVVAFQTGQPQLGWMSVVIIGACLGFLPYNFKTSGRAEVFLGDSGSTFLGFVLACMAVKGNWSDNNPVISLSNPILIFWVLIYDMVHITVERFYTGKTHTVREWLDYVGKDHLHHRMARVLKSQKKSVLFIYLLSASLGISAIALRSVDDVYVALLLLLQAVIIVLMITFLEVASRHRE